VHECLVSTCRKWLGGYERLRLIREGTAVHASSRRAGATGRTGHRGSNASTPGCWLQSRNRFLTRQSARSSVEASLKILVARE
jgi:hypothetical protein